MSGWGKMNFELGEPCPLKPQPMSADLRSSEPEERENGGDLSRRHRRQCPSVTCAAHQDTQIGNQLFIISSCVKITGFAIVDKAFAVVA